MKLTGACHAAPCHTALKQELNVSMQEIPLKGWSRIAPTINRCPNSFAECILMSEIYLDNSATTRPFDEVIELLSRIQRDNYGNPSSLHSRGIAAEKLLVEARRSIASLLQCRENEIYFTSSGTEANNLALKGAAYRRKRRGGHIITTQIEHPSVLKCCRRLEDEGFTVHYLPVNPHGYLDVDQLARLIRNETILVSTIHANNETGATQPLERIGAVIKERNPHTLYHVDGVQSFAKVPASLQHWQVDLYSCSSHKIHGPKGRERSGSER